MDLDLTDEQRLVQETARAFAAREIAPVARENDRRARLDTDLVAKMAAQGWIGALVPREHGGAGLDHLAYGLVVEEVGRACAAMRTVLSVQTSLVCSPIAAFGTDAQKARWLPAICSGRALGCFGLTEPDTGSDAGALRTRATKVEGGWRISGQKMWISFGTVADVALVFAQADPERGRRGLACFLVETAREGYAAQPIHGKLGMRGTDTASIALDDVWVPDDALLGEVGQGFRIAMTTLDSGRFSVAAGCVGICQAALDASVAYATERHQFGRPIAAFQLVAAMLADMRVRTDAARLLVRRAAVLKDRARPNTTETSIAKLYATEAAVHCADRAIQVHGGAGYVDDHPVERLLRDARVATLYEGTSEIQHLIIARALTGVDALVPAGA